MPKVAMAWCSLLVFSCSPTLAFSLLLPLLLLAILLRSSYYVRKGTRAAAGGLQLPPGSFGLPLGFGETVQFAFSFFFNRSTIDCPLPFLSSRFSKYGTVFKTHLLGAPIVVSMDPSLNKLILSNEGKLVQAYFPNYLKKVLGPLPSAQGKFHQRLRELVTSRFGPTAIQALHCIPVQEQARDLLHSWSNMVTLDVQQESQKLIISYILKVVLGLAPEDPKTILLKSDYHVLSKCFSAIPLDIPGTTYNKVFKARKRILSIIRELIEARKDMIGEGHGDFMDVLIKETREYGSLITEQDAIELLNGVVIANFDTSNILLTNVVKFLSENPHVVAELVKEHKNIRRNKKEDELLVWDDFKKMQFTKLVIKETLRIETIVQATCRDVIQDIVFKDMIIPKGWKILLNHSMMHLSPIHYKDPLKFDPWRWEDTKTNNHSSFLPFGGGIRSCLGSLFIEFEALVFIHYLVTRYRWQRVIEAGSHHDDGASVFLLPTKKKGLLIKVEPI